MKINGVSGKLGFSLLEVLVALALLALSFTALILVQGRSTRLAYEARSISLATQLARYQLVECKREAQKAITSVSEFKLEGTFSDLGHENISWECHAPKFNMQTPSASELEDGLKKNAKEATKKDVGATASISSPMVSMVTGALGDSVRELVVIVRWDEEELRVVTHVIDLTSMAGLSRMLSQGLKTLESSMPGAKKAPDKEGEPKPPTSTPPPGGPR